MLEFTVCKVGTGDFTSIQEAINQVRVHPLEPVTIYIKNGKYEEQIIVPDNKPDIRIVGESVNETIISGNLYAEMIDSENEKLGTFRTPVVSIHADNFRMENLTVENTAGYGPEIGQAVALYISGDRIVFKNIRLLGNQDTLYSSRGRQYFFNCYIEGHVDFIFGSGTMVFDQCEIHSLRQGYITAASTPKEIKYGFLFFDCRLTGSANKNSVFLGRPWRPYAHTVFVRTWMGPHIKREGWDNWRNEDNEKTVRYAEYNSTGPGASDNERETWSSLLGEKEVEQLTMEEIFRGWNDWKPQ
jgi:pectinesterase